jgi:hypothetical protein
MQKTIKTTRTQKEKQKTTGPRDVKSLNAVQTKRIVIVQRTGAEWPCPPAQAPNRGQLGRCVHEILILVAVIDKNYPTPRIIL